MSLRSQLKEIEGEAIQPDMVSPSMFIFKDGLPFIHQNPHSAFDKILKHGYRTNYCVEHEVEPFKDLVVQVLNADKEIATADFTQHGASAYCQNVSVHPDHQRRGIATALYVFAEKVFGRPLSNFWEGNRNQTHSAKAFWAQPNRPFGNL